MQNPRPPSVDPPPSSAAPARERIGVYEIDREHALLVAPGGETLMLRNNVWRVLLTLVDRRGRLVPHDVLRRHVWGDLHVSPTTVANTVSELRLALRAHDAEREYIETRRRIGYRLIADVVAEIASAAAIPGLPFGLVGRDVELDAIRTAATRVAAQRGFQGVLISGAAGHGKSALLATAERALLRDDLGFVVAHAVCVPSTSQHNAYHPFLRAFERLVKDLGEGRFAAEAECIAPWWLSQMPWLLDAKQREALPAGLFGSGPERPYLETRRLLEYLARTQPLALVLDDLQEATAESAGLLRVLLQDPPEGPVLLLGAFRQPEAALGGGHLDDVLMAAERSELTRFVDIGPLPSSALERYLEARFGSTERAAALRPIVLERSGGTPLLVRAICDWIEATGIEVGAHTDGHDEDIGIPEGIERLLDEQIRLAGPNARRLLSAAALLGDDFSVNEAATAAGVRPSAAERVLAPLARIGHLVEDAPSHVRGAADASRTLRFVHGTFTRHLAAQVTPSEARACFRRLVEATAGRRVDPTPATALHLAHCAVQAEAFDDAREWAHRAFDAFVARYDLATARRAVDLVLAAQVCSERATPAQCADWQLRRANLHFWADGPAVAGVRNEFDLAFELADRADEPLLAFRARLGSVIARTLSSTVDGLEEAFAWLLERAEAPELRAVAHLHSSAALTVLGHYERALAAAETALECLPEARPDVPLMDDLEVGVRSNLGYLLAARGSARSGAELERAHERAAAIGLPTSACVAHQAAATVALLRDDEDGIATHGSALQQIGEEAGLGTYATTGRLLVAATAATPGNPGAVEAFLASYRRALAQGKMLLRGFFAARLVEALARVGRITEAEEILEEVSTNVSPCELPLLQLARAEVGRAPATPGRDRRATDRRTLASALRLAEKQGNLLLVRAARKRTTRAKPTSARPRRSSTGGRSSRSNG